MQLVYRTFLSDVIKTDVDWQLTHTCNTISVFVSVCKKYNSSPSDLSHNLNLPKKLALYSKLDGFPGFAKIPKRKINQELFLNVTRLGFEPATSCIAIGYFNYLAIDQKEKLIKNCFF